VQKVVGRPVQADHDDGIGGVAGRAANNFLHLARGEDLSRLQVGCRMRAVWKEEREGFLLDLDRFTVL